MKEFKTSIKFLFIFIFVMQLTYCKKKKETTVVEEPINTPLPATPVLRTYWQIDSTDTAIKIIKINLLGTIFFGASTLTLDLDSNNVPDIKFNVIYEFGNSISNSCSIETANSTCFVLCDSIYKTLCNNTFDTTTTISYTNELIPKTLAYKDTLKTNDGRWRKGNFHIARYAKYWCYSCSCKDCYLEYSSLNWPTLVWRYIGIKYKGKVGWIKIYNGYNQGDYFSEFALVK